MFSDGARAVMLSTLVGFIAGCGPVREQANEARKQVSTTTQNVRKNLRKIQLHGEVDLEVMAQLTAVSEAYQKFLESKNSPPATWPDLEGVAANASNVQEARRQKAFVRFGVTREDLLDESQANEVLIAIQSPNDNSIWAVNYHSDVVPMTSAEFGRLPKEN